MIEIDAKDKKILYELDKDGRQTNKQIAKKTKISEMVVGNRIKALIEKNVIDYFYVKTNPSLLGHIHIKTYIRLHNITKQKEDALIAHLNKQKSVFWLASLRGKYDLECSLHVKNIAEYSKLYESLFGEWGDYILDKDVVVLEKAYTYTKTYLLPEHKSEEFLYTMGGEEPTNIDETDSKILSILNKEGRKPLIDISKQIALSADAINYRIKALRKRGIITGFGVKINFEKIGNKYNLITLKLQNMSEQKYQKLEHLARANKNTIIFIKTIGDHDVELEVETSKSEELDELMKSLRDSFAFEIKDYDIIEVTKEHRMTYFPF